MDVWEKWQRELLYSLQNVAEYKKAGLEITFDKEENCFHVDENKKDLHLLVYSPAYKKDYNAISPPRWNWEDSLLSAKTRVMKYINDWMKMRGVK